MEEEKELFERLEKEILEDELLFARVFGILEEQHIPLVYGT